MQLADEMLKVIGALVPECVFKHPEEKVDTLGVTEGCAARVAIIGNGLKFPGEVANLILGEIFDWLGIPVDENKTVPDFEDLRSTIKISYIHRDSCRLLSIPPLCLSLRYWQGTM